jgi:hypothetical protein
MGAPQQGKIYFSINSTLSLALGLKSDVIAIKNIFH